MTFFHVLYLKSGTPVSQKAAQSSADHVCLWNSMKGLRTALFFIILHHCLHSFLHFVEEISVLL